jgi:pimeloyl-ACP methyl ester carboxylesterase
MPKVKVNDIEMYYEVHGDGIPLIFITGYGGTSQGTRRFFDLQEFSKQHQCILIDNRGIGQSTTSEGPYSMKIMASDVAELLDALEIPRAHILGGSMGGMIAQEVALGYPDKVTSLILVSTSPGGMKVWELQGQLQAFYQMSWNFNPPEGMSDEELLEVDLGMCYSDDYIEKNHSQFSYTKVTDPIIVETLGKQYDAFVKHDTYDRLHEIKQKTLILHGSLDGLTFPEGALMLDERIPDSKLIMFEGLKHSFLVEERDKFTRIVLDFLREVDG